MWSWHASGCPRGSSGRRRAGAPGPPPDGERRGLSLAGRDWGGPPRGEACGMSTRAPQRLPPMGAAVAPWGGMPGSARAPGDQASAACPVGKRLTGRPHTLYERDFPMMAPRPPHEPLSRSHTSAAGDLIPKRVCGGGPPLAAPRLPRIYHGLRRAPAGRMSPSVRASGPPGAVPTALPHRRYRPAWTYLYGPSSLAEASLASHAATMRGLVKGLAGAGGGGDPGSAPVRAGRDGGDGIGPRFAQ